jgi:cytoskeletal protein CcmA (bactofilin family)
MALWKDNAAARQTPSPSPSSGTSEAVPIVPPGLPEPVRSPTVPSLGRVESAPPRAESLIAADITIEGKIEGGGSVRIAGKFKGDVNVQGDVTIEAGAKLIGSVRADKVTIAGELEGNVEEASRVELLQTGVVTGDLKSGTLTVAAGARMHGHAEFGLAEGKGLKPGGLNNGPGGERGVGS